MDRKILEDSARAGAEDKLSRLPCSVILGGLQREALGWSERRGPLLCLPEPSSLCGLQPTQPLTPDPHALSFRSVRHWLLGKAGFPDTLSKTTE